MAENELTPRDGGLIIPARLEESYDLLELLSERPSLYTVLVQRKNDGKQCVAKIFSGTLRRNGKREADILGRLNHPAIPKLVDYFEDHETGVLIREYVSGSPLDRYAAGRPLSEPAIISIGMKLCRVLEYLHGLPEPVIHRDIKPQNIIVNDEGGFYLIDFGISRFLDDNKSTDTVFAGTVAYAPPEQYGFRQTDGRADIYALGMVLEYLLTGSVDTASDKCGIEGSVLSEIIGKCTSFAPEKRFRNTRELYQSLARLNRRPTPRTLIAALLAVCFLFGGALGSLAGVVYERGRVSSENTAVESRKGMKVESCESMPVTPLSTMLGLNGMSEEELLAITGVYIYGDTLFDTLYTKNAADPSAEITELNPYISGHPYIIAFKSGPIEIGDGSIDDISCLKYLKNLKQLVIARNKISDLSPLEDLTQLEFLDLSCNPITDLSPLRSLPSLRQLYLNGCSASDPSPVYGLSSLELLYLSDNGIIEIEGVSALKNLKAVDFQGNKLVNASPLGKLENLERIFLGYNRISDLSFFDSLKKNKIMQLQISGNPIRDTSPLCSGRVFNRDRSVTINAGRLGHVDLSFLGDIEAFDEIWLDDTDCSQLSRYVSGKQISKLVVCRSGLADISWLETVSFTWNLDISGNPGIKDLSVLKNLHSLQVVTVSEDMRPLTEAIADKVTFSFNFV